MFTPETSAFTAHARLAPAATRTMLTPKPIEPPSASLLQRPSLAGGYGRHAFGAFSRLADGARRVGPQARPRRDRDGGDRPRRRARVPRAARAGLAAVRANPLRLLVRNGDLHRDLRARHRGDRVLRREVPPPAGRRLRRPADPRPYR